MAKKLKDYYDLDYSYYLAQKIKDVYPSFNEPQFIAQLAPTLESLPFNERQLLLAKALHTSLALSYGESIAIFQQILGEELTGSLGMFTEGWWLWPISKYVELYGFDNFEVSTAFSKELTKRFTSEYCMRPVIRHFPQRSLTLLLEWSTDDNQRVRRLASECLRIRLPWAQKMTVALDYFSEYQQLLTHLKDDPDKTIQKSVANSLNDLYKERPDLFEEIINLWQSANMSPPCHWIIKHASRTKEKNSHK